MALTITHGRIRLYTRILSLFVLTACSGGGGNSFPNYPTDTQTGTTTPNTDPPAAIPPPPATTPPTGQDTEAPHVQMLLPTANDTLTGTAPIMADASDNVGVTGVQFLVDNMPLGSPDAASPYWLQFDTTYLSDGQHSFSASASDAAGNSTSAVPHTVTVSNNCKTASPALTPWQNTQFALANPVFTVQWDVTPLEAGMNAAVGLAQNIASSFASLATEVRFNSDNTIDVRNGGTYDATNIVSYQPNQTFRIRMEIDLTSRTYSVFVTALGGAEQMVATNFAFRTEQQGVSSLDQWVAGTQGGVLKACVVSIAGNDPPVANAGPDQTVTSGALVSLDGSASTDNDGSIVSYEWRQIAGPSVALTGATNSVAFFTVDTIFGDVVVEFQLTVTDNRGATASDAVVITVHPAPVASNGEPTARQFRVAGFSVPRLPFTAASG